MVVTSCLLPKSVSSVRFSGSYLGTDSCGSVDTLRAVIELKYQLGVFLLVRLPFVAYSTTTTQNMCVYIYIYKYNVRMYVA